ncbi:MAG: hypothetical protein WCH46_00865 [bacterium]
MAITQKPLPFEFILEYLYPITPRIKPMFGCFALYSEEKILLMLREKEDNAHDNGVWIATSAEHHESLKKMLPSMRSIEVLGNGETNWQMIPQSADDFESSVKKICELIKKSDKRIGKIPKGKKKKV